MTLEEKERLIQDLKDFCKEVTNTPEKAREFLIKTGIYDKYGNLTDNYK